MIGTNLRMQQIEFRFWLIGFSIFQFSGPYKLGDGVDESFLGVEIDSMQTGHHIERTTWSQPTRIQSVVLQNDGSIILCDGDSVSEIGDNIEVVEILSTGAHTDAVQPTESQSNGVPFQQIQQVPIERVASQSTQTKKKPPSLKKRPLHMQPKQNGGQIQRFPCPRCGRDYSQRKNMRRHYRLECGQEPRFPCPICNLRFKRNNQMNSHMITRHGIKEATACDVPEVFVDA